MTEADTHSMATSALLLVIFEINNIPIKSIKHTEQLGDRHTQIMQAAAKEMGLTWTDDTTTTKNTTFDQAVLLLAAAATQQATT